MGEISVCSDEAVYILIKLVEIYTCPLRSAEQTEKRRNVVVNNIIIALERGWLNHWEKYLSVVMKLYVS